VNGGAVVEAVSGTCVQQITSAVGLPTAKVRHGLVQRARTVEQRVQPAHVLSGGRAETMRLDYVFLLDKPGRIQFGLGWV